MFRHLDGLAIGGPDVGGLGVDTLQPCSELLENLGQGCCRASSAIEEQLETASKLLMLGGSEGFTLVANPIPDGLKVCANLVMVSEVLFHAPQPEMGGLMHKRTDVGCLVETDDGTVGQQFYLGVDDVLGSLLVGVLLEETVCVIEGAAIELALYLIVVKGHHMQGVLGHLLHVDELLACLLDQAVVVQFLGKVLYQLAEPTKLRVRIDMTKLLDDVIHILGADIPGILILVVQDVDRASDISIRMTVGKIIQGLDQAGVLPPGKVGATSPHVHRVVYPDIDRHHHATGVSKDFLLGNRARDVVPFLRFQCVIHLVRQGQERLRPVLPFQEFPDKAVGIPWAIVRKVFRQVLGPLLLGEVGQIVIYLGRSAIYPVNGIGAFASAVVG